MKVIFAITHETESSYDYEGLWTGKETKSERKRGVEEVYDSIWGFGGVVDKSDFETPVKPHCIYSANYDIRGDDCLNWFTDIKLLFDYSEETK